MLILTRRPGESLQVGDDITVTILGVKGNQVRIGVNAPRDVGSQNISGRDSPLSGFKPLISQ